MHARPFCVYIHFDIWMILFSFLLFFFFVFFCTSHWINGAVKFIQINFYLSENIHSPTLATTSKVELTYEIIEFGFAGINGATRSH